ncbi:MAG: hypothetical protein U9R75_10590 [Candidatus Thermoplasmatota archaeon]|nr:hypothetical protein [Candidatus Thermoplasmatota archaeon]
MTTRRKNSNTIPIILISLGIAALITGSAVGMYRSREAQSTDALENDRSKLMDILTDSGQISISELEYRCGSLSENEIFDGRSARIELVTSDGDLFQYFIPDRESFIQLSDGSEQVSIRYASIDQEDGRIVPGRLEVTLRE